MDIWKSNICIRANTSAGGVRVFWEYLLQEVHGEFIEQLRGHQIFQIMAAYSQAKPVNRILRPFIVSYSQVKGESLTAKNIYPQLGSTMVLDFKNNSLFGGQPLKTVVVGYQEKIFEMNAICGVTDKLKIKFSPYGLSAFIKLPLSEINNQFLDASFIFGREMTNLYDSLSADIAFENRIEILEAFLLKRFLEPSNARKMIFDFAESIKLNFDMPDFYRLKKNMPCSLRQVERNFRQVTGLNISQFRRIARFEKAKGILENGSFARLTDVAYESGYYDQSHFISDFKELARASPKHIQSIR